MEATYNIEEPSKPVVAPPAQPLDPTRVDEEPVDKRAASLSGSSTRRDGDITENEKADSVIDPGAVPSAAADAQPKSEQPLEPPEHEWIEGPRLVMVMTGVTLACFLMFLDNSIISTVRPSHLT
jgi:hypothetical protein